MGTIGWLSRQLTEVPPGDGWLSAAERRAFSRFSVAPRQSSWRLGRWTAKSAVGHWLGLPPELVEVIAASDGAPEAWLDGERLPVSISLSHRSDRAIAAVTSSPTVTGCDIELIEPRSRAFVQDWLAPPEQRIVFARADADQALIANLIWSAKEAATKVRREGLRLNVRNAVVTGDLAARGDAGWRPLRVDWDDDAEPVHGWWRTDAGSVIALAATAVKSRPVILRG